MMLDCRFHGLEEQKSFYQNSKSTKSQYLHILSHPLFVLVIQANPGHWCILGTLPLSYILSPLQTFQAHVKHRCQNTHTNVTEYKLEVQSLFIFQTESSIHRFTNIRILTFLKPNFKLALNTSYS